MSGIEVVAVVAGIVSGFGASVTMFQQWKARNAKKKEAQESEIVLSESGPLVQKEYNHDFKRLGKKFAVGDDIGRAQMQAHLIILQQSIISLLSEALNGQSVDQIILAHLMATSKSVRSGAIQTLGEQFQRMSTAASVPVTKQLGIKPELSMSAERDRRQQEYCPAAIRLQNGGEPPKFNELRCKDCYWGISSCPPGNIKPRSPGIYTDLVKLTSPLSHSFEKRQKKIFRATIQRWHVPHRFFLKCHLTIDKRSRAREREGLPFHPCFGCIFCERKGKLVNFRTPFDFATHIESHSNAELDAEIDIEEL